MYIRLLAGMEVLVQFQRCLAVICCKSATKQMSNMVVPHMPQ